MILYIATNTANGKRYVGMTAMSLTRRINAHRRAVLGGSMTVLHCALRKYGFLAFTFEHVASAHDRAAMQDGERLLIAQEGTLCPAGYNMTAGGDGWHGPMPTRAVENMRRAQRAVRDRETPEQRLARNAAISAAKKGTPQPWASAIGKSHLGRRRSDEFKAAVSSGMKAYVAGLEKGEMARRSLLGQGKPRSPRGPRSEAQRAALSCAATRRYADPEERRKTAERTRKSWEKPRQVEAGDGSA